MSDEFQVPPGVDPNQMNAARVYDFLLGGQHNYAVDRAAVARMTEIFPDLEAWAWCNRGFHRRAVAWLASEAGIRQFVDLGSGLPTQQNTHDIVAEVAPDARVVYVDSDPMVAAHARDLLGNRLGVALVQADLRSPERLLADRRLHDLIDFAQPVAFLATAVLHFVSDEDDPWGIVGQYMRTACSGSYLALSHVTAEGWSDSLGPRMRAQYRNANEQARDRDRTEVERFFAGLELVPPYAGAAPAITYGGLWGAAEPSAADDDASRALYCGVARKP